MNKAKQKFDITFWLAVGLLLFILIFVVYLQIDPEREQGARPTMVPMVLGDWRGVDLPIDSAAIDLIKPDFYIYRNYALDGQNINVFIGHYETLEKSDLAHSPLVCYPGQGWEITEKNRIEFKVSQRNIEFASMTVQKGAQENLVVFGYRTEKLITGSIIKARLHLIKERILNNSERSAFIRFSTGIVNGNLNGANRLLINFIKNNTILLYESINDESNHL
jgi:EpsI family protein